MVKRKNKANKNKTNYKRIIFICIILIILLILIINNVILLRHIFPKQVDDVNPLIVCEKDLIEKSEFLMVIPLYQDNSIANNAKWCKEILALNKTLGMHGVYHTYQEFLEVRNETYILSGMEEFKKCFGYYPKYFEAPQLALNKENINLIKGLNMTTLSYKHSLFHKVYHCSDTGAYSNKLMDLI